MGGRVDEGARLESVWGASPRGFESHPIRFLFILGTLRVACGDNPFLFLFTRQRLSRFPHIKRYE